MPYKVRGSDVINADTGELAKRHKTRAEALAHLRELEANQGEAQGKGLDLSYAKSILALPDAQLTERLAIKRIGADGVQGYLALWGDAHMTDLERDFFTSSKAAESTDFWRDTLTTPRPLTWEHGQDGNFKARVVVGKIDELTEDEFGMAYRATLDRGHKYRKLLDKLIDEGALGTSSDSAPQYVQREKRGKSCWIKQWPLFAGALTATPAEPRMLETVHWKSLGVTLPGQASTPDGVDAQVLKAAFEVNARRLDLYRKIYY